MTTTMNEWLYDWLDAYVKPNLAEKTYQCYQGTIGRIIKAKPEFVFKNLDEITEIDIQRFINSLAATYSKSTLNDIRVVVNQSFRAAVINGVCEKNPISHLSIPKNASIKKVRALTQDEQLLVEEAARRDPLGHIVFFFLLTGLRSDELIHLSWDDYDAVHETICIKKSKTNAGVRIIPLIPEAKEIIDRQVPRCKFIFTNTRKQPLTESSLKKLYLRMRKATGIPWITNHVYRHSFATRLVESGSEYKALSKLLGHKDVAFTLRRYTDADLKFLRQQIYLLHENPLKKIS